MCLLPDIVFLLRRMLLYFQLLIVSVGFSKILKLRVVFLLSLFMYSYQYSVAQLNSTGSGGSFIFNITIYNWHFEYTCKAFYQFNDSNTYSQVLEIIFDGSSRQMLPPASTPGFCDIEPSFERPSGS